MSNDDIKKARPRKKFVQEDHHDDCGCHTGPFEEDKMRHHLALSKTSVHDVAGYVFFDKFAGYPDDIDADSDEATVPGQF